MFYNVKISKKESTFSSFQNFAQHSRRLSECSQPLHSYHHKSPDSQPTVQKLDLYFPYFTTECAIFQDVRLSILFTKLRFSIIFKKTRRKAENIWMVFCEELCAFASTHSIIAKYFLYIITKIFLAKISPSKHAKNAKRECYATTEYIQYYEHTNSKF